MSDGEFQIPDHIEQFYREAQSTMEEYSKRGFPKKMTKVEIEQMAGLKTRPMTGIEKIAQERLEQKTKHRHSIKSDWQQYPDYELAELAQCLIRGYHEGVSDCFPHDMIVNLFEKDYEEKLVIAGALIAAEIDRLNFKE